MCNNAEDENEMGLRRRFGPRAMVDQARPKKHLISASGGSLI